MGKEQQKGLGDLREAGEKKAGKRERQGVEGWVQRGGYKKGPSAHAELYIMAIIVVTKSSSGVSQRSMTAV